MSTVNPTQVPELIREILESAKGHFADSVEPQGEGSRYLAYDAAGFRSFTLRVSLVSRAWAQATRPLAFHSIKFTLNRRDGGQPGRTVAARVHQAAHNALRNLRILRTDKASDFSLALTRMNGLIALIRANPSIAGYVKQLLLHSDADPVPAYCQCSATLVQLFDTLEAVEFLEIKCGEGRDWYRSHQERDGIWWMDRLNEQTRAVFRHLLSRQGLRTLRLFGAMFPQSLWTSNPSLQWVTLSNCANNPTPGLNSAESTSTLHSPGESNLNTLVIVDMSSRMQAVASTNIRHAQAHLQALSCSLHFFLPFSSTDGNGTEQPLDLGNLNHLQAINLWVESDDIAPDDICGWILQTLATLPAAQSFFSFCLGAALRHCPIDSHAQFSLVHFFQSVDALVCNRARAGPHDRGFSCVVLSLKCQLCDTCYQSIQALSPEDLSVATLLPQLYQANIEGILALWVAVYLEDSSGKSEPLFPEYNVVPESVPLEIPESRQLTHYCF